MTRPKARTAASIILRGPNDFYCDEMERSIHDALCVVKRVLESKTCVAGGGSVEAALSIYLENFATTLVSHFKNWVLAKRFVYLLSCTIYNFCNVYSRHHLIKSLWDPYKVFAVTDWYNKWETPEKGSKTILNKQVFTHLTFSLAFKNHSLQCMSNIFSSPLSFVTLIFILL